MKNFLILLLLLLINTTFAQTGAKIEFKDKDNTLDFGKVKVSDSGLRDISFTNTGDAPLIVLNVHSTCGCLVIEKPKSPILPGKTGIISLKYDMHAGPIRRSLTIETNAVNADGGRILFKLRGEVTE
jgi:hypothetical protein